MSQKLRRFFEKDLPIGQQTPIVVNDYSTNSTSTTLSLVGTYYQGYEQPIGESLLWLTESFAGNTPPARAIKGQLWFNKANAILYAYNGLDASTGADSTQMTDWVKPVDISIQDLNDHINDQNNPHMVDKNDVDLGNVLNELQLVAANNLSDLTDLVAARNNLGVYDKGYIDSNFIPVGGTTGDASTVGGLSASQFLRSDVADEAVGTITFSNSTGAMFPSTTGTPITFDNTNIKITVNDGSGGFNIKGGAKTVGATDTYKKTGDGATKITTTFSATGGIIKFSVAPIGNENDNVVYAKTLELNTQGLNIDGVKVATEDGFTLNGNITPFINQNSVLGSSTKQFSNIYTKDLVATSSAITTPATASEIAFRDPANNNLKFTNKINFKTWLSTGDSVNELPRNYIDGLIATKLAAHTLSISTGVAKASSNDLDIVANSTVAKLLNVQWADGGTVSVPTGGKPQGIASLVNNTFYRVFMVAKVSGGVNMGIDTVANANAATLMADPTLSAAGYTKYRQTGWIYINSSGEIEQFFQYQDLFLWGTPKLEYQGNGSTSGQLHTLIVPPDITVRANIGFSFLGPGYNDTYALITATAQPNSVPSLNIYNQAGIYGGTVNSTESMLLHSIPVDTNSQIRSRFSVAPVANSVRITNTGFVYPRGRF